MCTKKEEQSNSVRNEDLNVTVNKQQVKYGASNLNTNDSPSVDFRIQTNIKFITDKKMKICLLINVLITVVCITASFIITYKLYSQLLQVQSEMAKFNARIESLSESCEQIRYEVPEQNVSMDNDDDDDDDDNDMFAEARRRHHDQVLQEEEESGLGRKDGNYELMLTNSRETLLTRLRRAVNRRTRTKEKSRRKVKSSGALAAHFKGSVPEIFVKDQGLVGPWYLDNSISRQYKFPKFHLTEGQCSIEVTEPALYLIYAQVYYVTSNALNSYSVFVRSEGSSENNIIARCSTMGPRGAPSHAAELSCYTATVYSLKANDRIFIQQTEKNRTIILRDGHSFFGLVRLNNSHRTHKT